MHFFHNQHVAGGLASLLLVFACTPQKAEEPAVTDTATTVETTASIHSSESILRFVSTCARASEPERCACLFDHIRVETTPDELSSYATSDTEYTIPDKFRSLIENYSAGCSQTTGQAPPPNQWSTASITAFMAACMENTGGLMKWCGCTTDELRLLIDAKRFALVEESIADGNPLPTDFADAMRQAQLTCKHRFEDQR